MKHSLPVLILLTAGLLASPLQADAPGAALPELGDSISGIISPEQEYRLGRNMMRQFRGRAPTVGDPLVQEYLERLAYRLAFHGDMRHPDLSLIMIRDRSINAFAAPGGVIGINVGLLLHAETEAELASVLAHELAHLSQRHIARQLAEQKQNQWAYWAGFLSTIALAAAGESQGALAMSMGTQAAMLDRRLSYSRQYEQEADRIGLQTLAGAGMDPHAMPVFFQRLERQSRMAGNIPEFLLTHPLTGSRIADTLSRAQQYPRKKLAQDSLDYQLARMRFLVHFAGDSNSIAQFQRQLVDTDTKTDRASVNRLGLTLAYLRERQYDKARETLAPLLAESPQRPDYVVAAAEIELADRRHDSALGVLRPALTLNPDSYPLLMYHARALILADQPEAAIGRLEAAARERSDDVHIWRMLIDAYTAGKNSLGVYRSRAEVYFLNGDDERALEQLRLAVNSVKGNYPLTAKLQKRMREMQQAKEDLKL